jgi:hypothetical protein
MKNRILTTFLAAGILVACAGEEKKSDPGTKEKPNTEAKKTTKAKDKGIALEPGKFHFDFPVVEQSKAKAGDKVFFVNMKLIRNSLTKGQKKFGTQILLGTMSKPGSKESMVKFVSDDTVPNSGIIPIPAGQSAKVGDMVVGKWAVNMTRGYVTDATNPKAPKVIFTELGYDNPAKASDKKTGIGQFEYTLNENEFIVVSKDYDPGSTCFYKDGSRNKMLSIWSSEGDMVIGKAFTTFTSKKKSDCKPIPLKTNFKAGDKVFAPYIGTMSPGTVTKVGKGRYGIKFDTGSEKMISFGEVTNAL